MYNNAKIAGLATTIPLYIYLLFTFSFHKIFLFHPHTPLPQQFQQFILVTITQNKNTISEVQCHAVDAAAIIWLKLALIEMLGAHYVEHAVNARYVLLFTLFQSPI